MSARGAGRDVLGSPWRWGNHGMIVLETHLGHGWVNPIPGQLSPATMALIEESSRGSRNRVGFEVEQVCCDGEKEVAKKWPVPHYFPHYFYQLSLLTQVGGRLGQIAARVRWVVDR